MDYNFEALTEQKFQKLCQALLVKRFPDVQCLPVAQPDGGRDALLRNLEGEDKTSFIAYQVKYTREPSSSTERETIQKLIDTERKKVKNLVDKGASRYYFLTNVSGTAHLESGSIDKVNEILTTEFGIPSYCWWRDDLDRRIDLASDLKWSYPEIIRGTDLLQALFEGRLGEAANRRTNAIRSFLAAQYKADSEVKFKQVRLQSKLLDLFTDVPTEFIGHLLWNGSSRPISEVTPEETIQLAFQLGIGTSPHDFGAADLLLAPATSERWPKIVLEGAPGQGKSTITQYICQFHRLTLLDKTRELKKVPRDHRSQITKLPIRVDLRDYASWLDGQDPFTRRARVDSGVTTLESFLARLIESGSGGVSFDVADLLAVASSSHLLIALDGFDEVADVPTRNQIVEEVSLSADRISSMALSSQMIVTSRPAAFGNTQGFPEEEWQHIQLSSLSRSRVLDYARRWMDANKISDADRRIVDQFLEVRMEQAHIRDLARNPMQLAILLSLIYTQGPSLPDKRTDLYTRYMDYFLIRESEKSAVVRDKLTLLMNLHKYVGWKLHAGAEEFKSGGVIGQTELKADLKLYLESNGHKSDFLDDLFKGMVERVGALVSRKTDALEFEVQPLREYFAAKFAYETAPYSPTGRDASGTRPDRFLALASNHYWLNVLRFYAGSYNTGELSSIVDCIIELSEKDEFLYTSHPQRLSMILLADYVLEQQPKSVRRLLAFVFEKDGFRRLLASAAREDRGFPLSLPEDSGRTDLVEHMWKILPAASDAETLRISCRVLSENASWSSHLGSWIKSRSEFSNIENWLEAGEHLSILRNAPSKELEGLPDEIGDIAIEKLAEASRFDILSKSADLFRRSFQAILSPTDVWAIHLGDTLGRETVLGQISNAINSYIFFAFRFPPDKHTSMAQFLGRVFGYPEKATDPTFPDGITEDEAQSISGLINKHRQCMQLSVADWQRSAVPWAEIVEYGRKHWGDCLAFQRLAVISTFIERKINVTKITSLFDSDADLCDRAYLARLHSNDEGWWAQSALEATNPSQRRLLALLVHIWATNSAVHNCAASLAGVFEAMSQDEWISLSATAPSLTKLVGDITGREPHELLGDGWLLDLGRHSWRLASFFSERAPDVELAACSRDELLPKCIDDANLRGFAMECSLQSAGMGALDWYTALSHVEKINAHNHFRLTKNWNEKFKRELNIPKDICGVICAKPAIYPLFLVGIAESSLDAENGLNAKPVGEIAQQQKWFESVS